MSLEYWQNKLKKSDSLRMKPSDTGFEKFKIFCELLSYDTKLTDLQIDHQVLEDEHIKYLSEALKTNNTLKSLVLVMNFSITVDGFKFLSDMLRLNRSLTNLHINDNAMEDKSVKLLCESLKTNTTLTSLIITKNMISKTGALYIGELLKTNRTLTRLLMSDNIIGEDGTKYLSEALEKNETLVSLNIDNNHINSYGFFLLKRAMSINKSLRCLSISENNVGQSDKIKEISDMLRENKTLESLIILRDRISPRGLEIFLEALMSNNTLTNFLYTYNEYDKPLEDKIEKKLKENKLNKNKF